MLYILLAALSAIAYGVAPLIYRPALKCANQFRVMSVFALYSIALGALLPWREANVTSATYAAAGLLGGIAGGWFYITSVKVGGAVVGNINSSMYVVLLPLAAGAFTLLPAAALILAGIAVSASGDKASWKGALLGLLAALTWTFSILLYSRAVGEMGLGGALFIRGLVVFAATALLGKGRICKPRRLLAGGFVDTFIGFGLFTLSLALGDPVVATLVISVYPLITALLERPFLWRRLIGAALSTAGLILATELSTPHQEQA